MPNTFTILKIELPYIKCNTHKSFLKVVNTYIHTLVNHNVSLFNEASLKTNTIHAAKKDSAITDKLLAPFWQKKQLGIMVYTKTGIALAKIWLQLMESNYPHLVTDYAISEINYVPKIQENNNIYKSEFWAPMRKATFNNGFWYYNTQKKGAVIADFNGLLVKAIQTFLDKYCKEHCSEILNNSNLWLAIRSLQHHKEYASLGYNKKHKHKLFTIEFETNLELPQNFHLGQAIGFGNGYFTKKQI
ncbi:MAG: hypothetical protein AB8B78_02225 [Polaribacter sp.]